MAVLLIWFLVVLITMLDMLESELTCTDDKIILYKLVWLHIWLKLYFTRENINRWPACIIYSGMLLNCERCMSFLYWNQMLLAVLIDTYEKVCLLTILIKLCDYINMQYCWQDETRLQWSSKKKMCIKISLFDGKKVEMTYYWTVLYCQ